MDKTTITGNWGSIPFKVEVTTTLDGRALGKFVAEFYEELIKRAPSMLDTIKAAIPTFVKAGTALQVAMMAAKEEVEKQFQD